MVEHARESPVQASTKGKLVAGIVRDLYVQEPKCGIIYRSSLFQHLNCTVRSERQTVYLRVMYNSLDTAKYKTQPDVPLHTPETPHS